MTVKTLLLRRRRWDPMVLAVGMLCLSLLISVGKIAFLFFSVCGLYLALARPRSWRGAPVVFTSTLAAWAIWQIGLSLVRGEPLDGNRVLSYAGLEFACALLPLGLGLVRHPAHALAWGARVGVIALVILAPIDYAMTGARVGLGKNEAIFAFVVGAVAIAARLPTGGRWRFLPDGRFWTYLGAVPIVLSGTRAAMLLFVVVALLDLRRALPRLRATGRRAAIALVAGIVAAMTAVVPVGGFLLDRIESGVSEMEAYEATGLAVGSVDTRMAMWSSAVRVLAEHPFIGVGGTARMDLVAEEAGSNAREILRYQHLHNLVLDEALSSGLVGVLLMSGAMVAFLSGAFRRADDPVVRDASVALVAFTFVFGLFHGVLLNEWMVLVAFASMAVILTELRRRRPFGGLPAVTP
ncbi:O-antigen ligase family protein [Aureimonas phyllosphaerae]|uniref:O-antigen ligase n=1 Tax=Aureimonas phyllosphaerae TaxID=1166078 RepID=A0A7W6FTH2_9HYPH|nr:O-antigen ligase family protein [Aureimonas phyllosphaerae]MBB3935043.1 O-antigen ligase [Aureimonas phyllosphaerae]MBB3959051.1 O-antigen ligase [Aureimonas phyllosphaerae]SFF08565.1 O-antigen ligase [Aureimonas phyllosphaerae]